MNFQVKFEINEKIFLKDPEGSELGKLIVKNAIDLIYKIGFEQFTFKKLASEINSTEASIYRYFENKHCLLLYIVSWYWCYMNFLLRFKIEHVADKKDQLKIIIHLLTHEFPENNNRFSYNGGHLFAIIISESSKVYLTKYVAEENGQQLFKPYDDLCIMIANVITAYNPRYQFPRSLSSTLIETAHRQRFFKDNLTELTDFSLENKRDFAGTFLEGIVFKVLETSK